MLVAQPKYRRPLNSNQILLLNLCYKFRFISTKLVAELLGKDRSTVYESLFVLEKQGYILKRYDSSYKLRGQSASYCLSAQGIRYLASRNLDYYDKTTLKNFYRNKSIPDNQIAKCLFVFQLFLVLKKQTGKQFSIYTQYEFDRTEFPYPAPLLKLENHDPDKPDFVLDVFDVQTPTWQLRRRIQHHENKADEDEYTYPDLLLVASNVNTEKRLFRVLQNKYLDFCATTTQLELLMGSKDGKVWVDVDEADEDEFVRTNLFT
jgi:hypothetical protein